MTAEPDGRRHPEDPGDSRSLTSILLRPRRLLMLVICCAGLLLQSTALTGVAVAVPSIQEDLTAGAREALLITAGFQTTVGGLLFVGAALAERFGPRRIYVVSLAAFSVTSLLCLLAPTAEALVGLRVLQAIASAPLVPAGFSILTGVAFPDPSERPATIGIWSAVTAGSGPVLSIGAGTVVTAGGWRYLLLSLAVAGSLASLGALLALPATPTAHVDGRASVGRLILLTATMILVLIVITGWGAAPLVRLGLAAVAAGLVVTAILVGRRRPGPYPTGQRRLLRTAVAFAFLIYLLFNGSFFCNLLYLQHMHGLTPLAAAAAYLPASLSALLSPLGARLASEGRGRRVLAAGLTSMAAGLLVVGTGAGGPLMPLMIGYSLIGMGISLSQGAVLVTALAAAGPASVHSVAALLNTTTLTGGAVGAALLGSVTAGAATSWLRDHAPASSGDGALEHAAQGGAALTGAVPAHADQGTAAAIVYQAFTHGMRVTHIAAGLFAGALAILASVLRSRRRPRTDAVA